MVQIHPGAPNEIIQDNGWFPPKGDLLQGDKSTIALCINNIDSIYLYDIINVRMNTAIDKQQVAIYTDIIFKISSLITLNALIFAKTTHPDLPAKGDTVGFNFLYEKQSGNIYRRWQPIL